MVFGQTDRLFACPVIKDLKTVTVLSQCDESQLCSMYTASCLPDKW